MKDCKGKELSVGQEVVFSVGTKLMTGIVCRIRDAKRYNRTIPTTRITLNPPEEIADWNWEPIAGVADDAPWHERYDRVRTVTGYRQFREICEEERILVIRDAK